jgi:hypothetical protein
MVSNCQAFFVMVFYLQRRNFSFYLQHRNFSQVQLYGEVEGRKSSSSRVNAYIVLHYFTMLMVWQFELNLVV